MNKPDIFTLVESPQYSESFDTFAELRAAAERLAVGLNQIQSWFTYDEQDDLWGKYLAAGEKDRREFHLCICMPRKTAFTVWTTRQFERVEVDAWIKSWVFPHIRRWYGMTEVAA